MAYESLVPIAGTVASISPFSNDCCSQQVTLITENGPVNAIVSGNTFVIDSVRLRPGMSVIMFYDSSLPVPLIFPPQYRAEMITMVRSEQQVMLNYFDQDLMAEDQSLKLNLGRRTVVSTINGQRFSCNPGNHILLVYYSTTTRSIPPQTTPDKIIVLCE